MRCSEIHVERYPEGTAGPEDFRLVETIAAEPTAGQVLVRNTWTSVDPGLRLRLRAQAPEGYFSSFPLGRPMDGILTIGEVLASRADGFEVGDTVGHSLGWRTHSLVDADAEAMNGVGTLRVLDAERFPAQWHLGPLGAMGLTAYAGLSVADALNGGERVWISAAAGAVGSLATQIALRLGHDVVASAGSDDKVEWLTSLGARAFNYRTQSPQEALRQLAPDGIDVYFDNVGGDHLEAALDSMRMFGRIALCGSISEYESAPAGPRNLFLATAKHLRLTGFRGSLHLDLLEEMQALLGPWLLDGSLTYPETVYDGLAQAPQALADMLAGRTTGKTLVRL
jgi:NADPH-dependent curcumin reductase CurA